MARYACSITKEFQFRGGSEQFANVYHFDANITATQAQAEALIDALKTLEAPVHSTTITFKTGRVWEVGGTPAQNETIALKDLSGGGSLPHTNPMYRELAVVVRLDTGRNSSTGRKIYLRKFIHAGALGGGSAATTEGTLAIAGAQKTPFLTYGNAIREVAPAVDQIWTLEAPGGQNLANNAAVSVLDYLRVRELRK